MTFAPLSTKELARHAYALDVSGYTVIPQQLCAAELDGLRTGLEPAFAAYRAAPGIQPHTNSGEFYAAIRCLYLWGEPFLRLLAHPTLHGLAGVMMPSYRLWDMTALSALPSPPSATCDEAMGWHNDMRGIYRGADAPAFLWFFFCMVDVTAENGATWVVPGSHRLDSVHAEPVADRTDPGLFPSRLQLCARAGDLLVLNPTLLHSVGSNHTARARDLVNVGLCHGDLRPLVDHWTIAGPEIQQNAADNVRLLLRGCLEPLLDTWPLRP